MSESGGELGVVVEEDVPVPVRDGVVLRANVFRPEAGGKFPALLMRGPYGKAASGLERYVRAGYVVVSQDCRGRYASAGDFIPFTAEHAGEVEGHDGYDSVEWLAQQPYCNGKVGTMGPSYLAWTQWMLARLRPPHLVAMCAHSIPLELTEVDWPGAFRPGRRVYWWMNTIAPDLRRRRGLPGPHTPAEAMEIWHNVEQGRWICLLPWVDLPQYLPEGLAEYVEDWLQHPDRRAWRLAEAHKEVEVPNLDISGWYDHCNGTLGHLGGMQMNARTEAARTGTKLIIGPWNHVGLGNRRLGEVDFGFQAQVDLPDPIIRWFDHWLKGVSNGVDGEPSVRYFVMGSGRWRTASTWPPQGLREAVYYLSGQGHARRIETSGLLSSNPSGDEPCDSYSYDPKDPVPTLWQPQSFAGVSDRRVLEYRRDILYYRTPPLAERIEVVGHPEVILYASSSAPDTDFFARLVDEHPDGRALDVCAGMVRARHRHSLDGRDFLNAGEVTQFKIKLGPAACCFLKGHRLRLEITSSDFPNYDRNHNTGRNDLADAELATAEQKVLHSGKHPSRLILTVV